MKTGKEIIATCVQRAMRLQRDPIQSEIRDFGLDSINNHGQRIYDAWPWDNSVLEEIQVTSDSGILTMPVEVDAIRAVRLVDASDANNFDIIFNRHEVLAVAQGEGLANSDSFEFLRDETDGRRRIRVQADTDSLYAILATERYVKFTTKNYELRIFPIDRAEQALEEFVCDDMRVYRGVQPLGLGPQLLQLALEKETDLQDREMRIVPRNPNYDEIGFFPGQGLVSN